jgi:hypothetical protein
VVWSSFDRRGGVGVAGCRVDDEICIFGRELVGNFWAGTRQFGIRRLGWNRWTSTIDLKSVN